MKPKPIGGKILVSLVESNKEMTASGLYIPEQAREKSQEAIVEDVGDGARDEKGNLIPFNVTVGDKVLLAKFAGTPFEYGKKEYRLVIEDEILAKL
jgi:chaperonin GroES